MTAAVPIGTAFRNVVKVLGSLRLRRRVQIGLLFFLQLITASLEVLSIGTIIPFLTALADPDRLLQNPWVAAFAAFAGVTHGRDLTIALAVTFSAAIISANLFRLLTLFCQQYLAAAIAVDLGHMLFTKTLHKPYAYFLEHNSSQLIGNTTNDLNGTLGTIYSFFSIMTQGLVTLFILAGLLAYNPAIAFVLSAVVACAYSVIMITVNRRLRHNGRILSDSYYRMLQALQEGFGGVRYILLGNLQDYFAGQFRQADRGFRRKNAENNVIQQSPRLFLESVAVAAMAGLVIHFMASGRTMAEIIPLMGFLVFACYRLLPAVQQIYAAIGAILGLSVSLERVLAVIASPLPPAIPRAALPMRDALAFDHAYFDYHQTGEKWTLADLCLSIKAKSTVAFVGQTGSGKSTAGDLILGLMAPQKGRMMIDGVPLTSENLPAWQAGIAHVPQTIFLLDTTIAENIAFGAPADQIDHARVQECARLAQIHDFITALPDRFNQKVGERGVRLSGGQRQRIGIARALYQNPSVIVFDEATSALDNKTEQDVVAALATLKQKLTIILIAHRLSTVQAADHIFVFDQGRIAAHGTYNELLDNPNFSTLVRPAPADIAA